MSDNTNFNELKSLLEWVNQSGDIEELSIKYGDIELALSKTPGGLSHLKAAPAAAPAAITLRPLRPREELFVLRSACGADVRSICGGVQPGGGRIVQCLATNAGSLSPACRDVLAPFAAR